jgi:heme/copper-type cytochrome/quinol oxidase subunit 2
MTTADASAADPPGTDDGTRLDRELDELLQELRVLLPGTTVLLGFLLALAFSGTFADASRAEEAMFTVAFSATAMAVVLMVAPVVRHRARFRDHDKEALLKSANRIALVASVLLALALTAVVTLVVEHLYGWRPGIASGAALIVAAGWLWWGWAGARAASDRAPRIPTLTNPEDVPGPSRAPAGTRAANAPGGPDR